LLCGEGGAAKTWKENAVQDLFQNYVDDLIKLREAFHEELAATAAELSKAMGDYSQRSEAALTSFMEKVSTRGEVLEAAAAARLDQFRGLPAKGSLPVERATGAAERAVADALESDGDRKPRGAIALVKSDSAA
jgi:hypothetical protein